MMKFGTPYHAANQAIAKAKGFELHDTGGGFMSFAKWGASAERHGSVFYDEGREAWAAGAYDWQADVFNDDSTNFGSLFDALDRAAELLEGLEKLAAGRDKPEPAWDDMRGEDPGQESGFDDRFGHHPGSDNLGDSPDF